MVTLSDLITQTRLRLGIANATYISDATIALYLNQSFAELYELILESNEDWCVVRFEFNIPASQGLQDGYKLPADFYKVLRVDKKTSSNDYYVLTRINIRDENLYNPNGFGFYSYGPTAYNTEVSTDGYTRLRVFPNTQQSGDYRILYYPAFTPYTLSDTVVMGPPGQYWEEHAVLDTMIKICGQDETDATVFIGQKAACSNRIKSAAAARDIGQAEPRPMSIPWYDRGRNGGGWF